MLIRVETPIGELFVERKVIRRRLLGDQNGRCHYCGGRMTLKENPPGPATITLDHVVPLAAGGADELSNMVGACSRCNCRKGDLSAAAYKRLLANG